LRDQEMQSVLSKSRPNWLWEPTLVEVEGEHIHVYTGVSMRARLLFELGPRKAMRVARLANQFSRSTERSAAAGGRRSFLRQAVAATGSLFLAGVGWQSVSAPVAAAGTKGQPPEWSRATDPESESYIQMALNSGEYHRLRAKLATTYSGRLNPEVSAGIVFANSTSSTIIVAIPLQGGAGHSFFSQAYNTSNRQSIDTLTGLFTLDAKAHVVAYVEHNESPLLDATYRQSGELVSGVSYNASGRSSPVAQIGTSEALAIVVANGVQHSCFQCMQNCLGAQGVPLWLLGVIAVVCAVACIGTLGLGCVVCLEGLLAGFTFALTYCTNQCQSGIPWGGYTC
jgi:hypothetical protein